MALNRTVDLCVIGAGSAGLSVAAGASQLGERIRGGYAGRRIDIRGLLLLHAECEACSRACFSLSPTDAIGGIVKATPGTPR